MTGRCDRFAIAAPTESAKLNSIGAQVRLADVLACLRPPAKRMAELLPWCTRAPVAFTGYFTGRVH
jgi:hypothetical protein